MWLTAPGLPAVFSSRVWLQRIRVMYSFVDAGVPVIMSDLDAIWLHDAAADLLSKPLGQDRGYDLMLSPGYFPFELHKQMGVVGEPQADQTECSYTPVQHC